MSRKLFVSLSLLAVIMLAVSCGGGGKKIVGIAKGLSSDFLYLSKFLSTKIAKDLPEINNIYIR